MVQITQKSLHVRYQIQARALFFISILGSVLFGGASIGHAQVAGSGRVIADAVTAVGKSAKYGVDLHSLAYRFTQSQPPSSLNDNLAEAVARHRKVTVEAGVEAVQLPEIEHGGFTPDILPADCHLILAFDEFVGRR